MDRIATVSGTGPVYVDDGDAGHCAFEINVYKDGNGAVSGRGHVMGDSLVLGRMARGKSVELASSDDGRRFRILTGVWQPGDRRIDIETGPDIVH